MHIEVIIVVYLIFLFLKKLNFLFFEVRFIGDKLTIINENSKKEIVLDHKVKFSIEKEPGYKATSLHILNISYYHNYSYEKIKLFNFSKSYKSAELVLERINK